MAMLHIFININGIWSKTMAKRSQTHDYDLIVIGSGAGGSAAANIVASGGKKVAIVEIMTCGACCFWKETNRFIFNWLFGY